MAPTDVMPTLLITASIFENFHRSDLFGKGIVVLLIVLSIIAWNLMLFKANKLRSLQEQNHSQKNRLLSLESFCSILPSQHTSSENTLSEVFHSGLLAYHHEIRIFGIPNTEISRNRCMKNIETAMARVIAKTALEYEGQMTMLGSIVTASPFLGLLGTIWGVMSAFDAVATGGSSTIQHLAPGVSSALLTTLAALVVAIPSVVGYNLLAGFIRKLTVELETDSTELSERFEQELLLNSPKR
jgi:biopolymer transport protein TolQ